jgi:hypothetical protein
MVVLHADRQSRRRQRPPLPRHLAELPVAGRSGWPGLHPLEGFYLGNWNASVSGNSYNNGASLETDLYGGYRFEPMKDVTADLGVLFYVYPGAKLNAAPAVSRL